MSSSVHQRSLRIIFSLARLFEKIAFNKRNMFWIGQKTFQFFNWIRRIGSLIYSWKIILDNDLSLDCIAFERDSSSNLWIQALWTIHAYIKVLSRNINKYLNVKYTRRSVLTLIPGLLLLFYITRCYKAYSSPRNDSVYRKINMFLINHMNTEFSVQRLIRYWL